METVMVRTSLILAVISVALIAAVLRAAWRRARREP